MSFIKQELDRRTYIAQELIKHAHIRELKGLPFDEVRKELKRFTHSKIDFNIVFSVFRSLNPQVIPRDELAKND